MRIYIHISHVPIFFHIFLNGCSSCIRQDWKPNKALYFHLLLELLETIDAKFLEATTPEESNQWVVAYLYVVASYAVMLRGTDGFMLDINEKNISGMRRGLPRNLENMYISVCKDK